MSMIASKIGEPIATDKLTCDRTHPSYARILVEVDATKPLVRTVLYKSPFGGVKEQVVEYEYEPYYCTKCHKIGHANEKCEEGDQQKKNARGRSKSRRRRQAIMFFLQIGFLVASFGLFVFFFKLMFPWETLGNFLYVSKGNGTLV